MYELPYYKEPNGDIIKQFIKEHPFSFIAGCDENNKPVATQIPVLIEQRNQKLYMVGHMMRSTDHHKAFEKNPNVLVVFTGQHTYVSATWYSDPHQASTFNYMSVQVKGAIRFLDELGLAAILTKTTLHFENGNKESTTIFDNLPDQYKNPLMKAIVGFEIEVHEINHVFKLSQDRDAKSYDSIKEKLAQQGGDAGRIAEEMEKRTKKLFPDRI